MELFNDTALEKVLDDRITILMMMKILMKMQLTMISFDENADYLLWLASWRREPPKKLQVRKHSFAAHTHA